MTTETRERFPITPVAEKLATDLICNAMSAHSSFGSHLPRTLLESVAPLLVRAWIDGLSDRELLEMRFATNNQWCQSMRDQLRKMAQVPA